MELIQLSSECDYGNWIPDSLIRGCAAADGALAGTGLVVKKCLKKDAAGNALLAGSLAGCGLTAYLKLCQNAFDFRKGNLMGKMHQVLLDHLDWDGEGELLDIGCGAGALSVRCAKAFPDAVVTGIDRWGKEWNYSREQCQRNAVIEQVDDRVRFQKGDAAHLGFGDQTFDAVVSCLVFHEVRSMESKPDLMREALRVLRKGGSFAFLELFGEKRLYGGMHDLIRELELNDFREVHYIPDLRKYDGLIPAWLQVPGILRGAGILYGKM